MVYVTVLLPVAKGVGAYAALKRAADTTFDDRSRGQVMADTFFERVTGQPADIADAVAVNLVIADETLLGGDDSPAVMEGYGPVPAAVARRLVDRAVTATSGRGARCGGCTAVRSPGSWWRWSRGRGSSRVAWRASSIYGTGPAARRTAMRRSGTETTPGHITGTDPPVPKTGSVSANAATMPRNRTAGRWLPATKTVCTQQNS
jgi:hypothetical protein